jgi:transposase-like protein
MEKRVRCTKCQKTFLVEGEPSRSKEVPQDATSPYCHEPNEVMWPMTAGYKVKKLEG